MLEIKHISKKFGTVQAVNKISFSVESGKIYGVLGRNGAGKSTIFRMILGILPAEEGQVLYDGKKINALTGDTIGYLPEEGSLIVSYTVLEQCLYYGALKSMREDHIQEQLMYWLAHFHITEYMNKKIKDLSKGNRQKIQFIIAILHQPNLLILDEPFSGLDPISVEEIKQVILELKEKGTAIVFSSHRMDHVEMLCEDILILDRGNKILQGDIKEIKREYGKQRIELVGNILPDDLEKIKKCQGVLSVERVGENTYIISLVSGILIQTILSCVASSTLEKISVLDVSLNDIFLDKVGRYYEE